MATSVDPESKKVRIADDQELKYDILIIATGANYHDTRLRAQSGRL